MSDACAVQHAVTTVRHFTVVTNNTSASSRAFTAQWFLCCTLRVPNKRARLHSVNEETRMTARASYVTSRTYVRPGDALRRPCTKVVKMSCRQKGTDAWLPTLCVFSVVGGKPSICFDPDRRTRACQRAERTDSIALDERQPGERGA